ncbi:CRISPR-associated protein Cas4 [Leptolyngbya sp. FACHB-711]|uniref:CRISPR-associated protein Cas4 n=1 Tax=Leptolyngbya sp. FACHB-711 TaxID=2692813 RepID=UPI001683258E|nr:CRISPR-associated protein Cas4 [Leptolyngbya sp. FACHB-711]MBD2027014.1 CRISPR-associated protein Cas4 [Leptolyngbya sp. FACHB-711]
MIEDYLPLAYLNAWEYCPRRFYFEYVLGEMEDNEHIILGRHLHRNINEEAILQEGNTRIHQQQWVWSDRLQVSGIIDAVEEREGQLIPIEYKKGKMAKHLNDHFQLCGAALCLEERTGQSIAYGEIFYHTNRRRQKVLFTAQLRQMTEEAIAAAHVADQKPMPAPIDHAKKCQACSLQGICLPFEVKHLRQTQ